MKFLYNKFIIVFIIIILGLFLIQYYYISQSYHRDTNSYVTLLSGSSKVIRSGNFEFPEVNEKFLIETGDTIITIGDESVALIEWGDKSITRLAGNSKILVKENFVGEDLSKINISFELLKGKTWSNVVTILTGENHFKEEINGNIAAVRGTVFEASADGEYISVINHAVEVLASDGETYSINEGETISLKDFVIEALKESIDKSWEQLNKTLDKNYLKDMKSEIEILFETSNPFKILANKIKYYFDFQYRVYYMMYNLDEDEVKDYVDNLSETKREKFLYELQELLQTINYESGDNEEMYEIKLKIKNLLIYLSDDENYKQTLIEYSIYDLNDLASENLEYVKETMQKTFNSINSYSGISIELKNKLEDVISLSGIDLSKGFELSDENKEQIKKEAISIFTKFLNFLKSLSNIFNFN